LAGCSFSRLMRQREQQTTAFSTAAVRLLLLFSTAGAISTTATAVVVGALQVVVVAGWTVVVVTARLVVATPLSTVSTSTTSVVVVAWKVVVNLWFVIVVAWLDIIVAWLAIATTLSPISTSTATVVVVVAWDDVVVIVTRFVVVIAGTVVIMSRFVVAMARADIVVARTIVVITGVIVVVRLGSTTTLSTVSTSTSSPNSVLPVVAVALALWFVVVLLSVVIVCLVMPSLVVAVALLSPIVFVCTGFLVVVSLILLSSVIVAVCLFVVVVLLPIVVGPLLPSSILLGLGVARYRACTLTDVGAPVEAAERVPDTVYVSLTYAPAVGGSASALLGWRNIVHGRAGTLGLSVDESLGGWQYGVSGSGWFDEVSALTGLVTADGQLTSFQVHARNEILLVLLNLFRRVLDVLQGYLGVSVTVVFRHAAHSIGTFDLWEGGGRNLGLFLPLGKVEVVLEVVGENGGRGQGFR